VNGNALVRRALKYEAAIQFLDPFLYCRDIYDSELPFAAKDDRSSPGNGPLLSWMSCGGGRAYAPSKHG
jgi:hypothetical protein